MYTVYIYIPYTFIWVHSGCVCASNLVCVVCLYISIQVTLQQAANTARVPNKPESVVTLLLGCPPAQDSSHHQDDITFLGSGIVINLHFVTGILGGEPQKSRRRLMNLAKFEMDTVYKYIHI